MHSEPEEAPTQPRTGLGRTGAECDPSLVIDVSRAVYNVMPTLSLNSGSLAPSLTIREVAEAERF